MTSHTIIDSKKLEIGKRIAHARRAAGLSQHELALRLNVTDNAVTQWETGRALIRASKVPALCRELSIEPEWLLTGNDQAEVRTAQTQHKLTLLRMLRSLDPERQETALRIIEALGGKMPS